MAEIHTTMIESAASETHRIEMNERRRNYMARFIGFVTGLAGGTLISLNALKRSLREYIRGRLEKPNFCIDFDQDKVNITELADRSIKSYINHEHQQDKLEELKRADNHTIRDLYKAPRYPDKAVEAAYLDLCEKDVDGVFSKARASFIGQWKKLFASYDALIEKVTAEYTAARKGGKSIDLAAQDLAEELRNHRNNFTRLLDEARIKYYERPIFNEMIKGGKKPGHMGLGIRQAHNKGQLIIFSIVSTVGLGLLGWGIADRFLPRPNTKREPAPTHMQQIKDERDRSAATEPLGSVMH